MEKRMKKAAKLRRAKKHRKKMRAVKKNIVIQAGFRHFA
jgi:hypothetical protein